jgi:hypothetical protein
LLKKKEMEMSFNLQLAEKSSAYEKSEKSLLVEKVGF